MYESLYNLSYKDQAHYLDTYNSRFSNYLTIKFSINIKQFGRKNSYPAFFCPCNDISLLQEKIFFVYRDCMRIINSVPGVAIAQFMKSCLVNEIKSTNDIEGVYSSRKELRDILNSEAVKRTSSRFGSIVNRYEKLIHLENISFVISQDVRNLFDDFLYQEIEKDNLENLPDGDIFRKSSVDIVSSSQKTIHRGLYPESEIIGTMDKSLQILNDDNLPLLVRVAIFHCLFGYIHPFYDGNGRTSRFISSYFLAKELHPTIALQLSVLIKEQKTKYYKMFSIAESENNKGDLTPFIIGFLDLILQAITLTTEQLQEKFSEYKHYQKLLTEKLENTNHNVAKLYDILLQSTVFSDSGLSVKDLCQIFGKTQATMYGYTRNIPKEHLFVVRRGREKFIELNYDFLNSLI